MDPVATSIPWGSNDKHTISILCPLRVWYLCPVFASQIFAVLSKDPVTILSLNRSYLVSKYYVPIWIIKCHCVNNIFMFIKRQQLSAAHCVPNFACSIITTSDKSIRTLGHATDSTYLSPDLLKAQLVKGKR